MVVTWTTYKSFVASGLGVQYLDQTDKYWLYFDNNAAECFIHKTLEPEITAEFETVYKPSANVIRPTTGDRRPINAINRVPPGYTISPVGNGDAISTKTYGGGPLMRLDDTNVGVSNKVTFQLLEHWYGIGGRVIWESASLDDSMSATLVAPASTGFTNVAGDFTKYNVGGPYNLIIPVATGTGDWANDLSAKIGSSQVLKCTPVPIAGNTGWFNYNSDTNALTPSFTQTGGYNIYDFDITLFKFARNIWGRKLDGSESVLESTDVVGKLLFNTWQIRFDLACVTAGVRCGIVMVVATKKNT